MRLLLIGLCVGLVAGLVFGFVPAGAAIGLFAAHLWLAVMKWQQSS